VIRPWQTRPQGRRTRQTDLSRDPSGSQYESATQPAETRPLDRPAPAPPKVEPTLGTIGRFVLRQVLGQGTFGRVYRAYDPVLDREIALKVPRFPAGHEELVERFHREARAVARLKHPNIVAVFESGFADGHYYIASEFVEGMPLANRIARGPVPLRDAATWVRDLARGLAYAHHTGIIHRDIKPANIMLEKGDWPQLMDFGLARRLEDATLTTEGAVMGTPAYMPPEQAVGDQKRIGPRSDQYSLGVVLYELLTGQRPFTGGSIESVIHQVLHSEPIRPRKIRLRIPLDLEAICLKAIAKRLEHRYADAGEFADDLERWLDDEPTEARPVGNLGRAIRWARSHPALAASGSLAAVGLASAAVLGVSFAIYQSYASQEITNKANELARKVIELNQTTNQLFVSNTEKDKALLAEKAALAKEKESLGRSQRLVYRSYWDKGVKECIDDAVAPGLLEIAKACELAEAIGDPKIVRAIQIDLAHWSEQLVPLRGIAQIKNNQQLYLFATLGTDGRTALLRDGPFYTPLRLWDLTTGKAVGRSLTMGSPAADPKLADIQIAVFRPDGKVLLTGDNQGGSQLWDVATAKRIGPRLSRGTETVFSAAFSPDGKRVITGGTDDVVHLWDAETGSLLAETPHQRDYVNNLAFSPDGTVVTSSDGTRLARLWHADTLKPIGQDAFGPPVVFHPDGKTFLAHPLPGKQRWHSPTLNDWEHWNEREIQRGDLATGKLAGKSIRHEKPIYAHSFTPDAKTILTSGDDLTARLWRADDFTLIKTLPHQSSKTTNRSGFAYRYSHELPPVPAALRPDGKVVVTLETPSTARLWNTSTGEAIGPPMAHRDVIVSLQFSPDSSLLLTGGGDSTARFWDAATGQPLGAPLPHSEWVSHVSFGADSAAALTYSADGVVRRWETESARRLAIPLSEHQSLVTSMVFRPDGKTELADDRAEKNQWPRPATRPLFPSLHGPGLLCCTFRPDGRVILTGGVDSTARFWDAATGKPIGTPIRHARPVTRVACRPDGKGFLTVSDTMVRLWDSETGEPFGPPIEHPETVAFATFRPDGQAILTATKGAVVWLMDAATSRLLFDPLSHEKPGTSPAFGGAAFSADGRILVTSCMPNGVRIWDAVSGRPSSSFLEPKYGSAAVIRPDGKVVAAGSGEDLALLYEAPSGRPLTRPGNSRITNRLTFRADGKVLVAASSVSWSKGLTSGWSEAVVAWDGETGERLCPPMVHEEGQGQIQAIAFSPDGKTLLSSTHGTVRLWHIASGTLLGLPIQAEGWTPIKTASVSERGKDGRTYLREVWRMSGPNPSPIHSLEFSPDGKSVLVGEHAGATLRAVPPRYPSNLRAATLWLQVTTGMEMDADGTVHNLNRTTWWQRARNLQTLEDDPTPGLEATTTSARLE
jgi:WD40 repeat protein/serine/threonine protein kinase